MKIHHAASSHAPRSSSSSAAAKHADANLHHPDDANRAANAPPAAGKNFANILDRTASAYEQQREAARADATQDGAAVVDESDKDSEESGAARRRTDEARERAEDVERAREQRRADGREDEESDGGEDGSRRNGEQFGGARQLPAAQTALADQPAPLASRAILNIVDLERIVSAARSQMTLDGRREITLELTRSVLDGLRIKLRQNGDGRIEAELIASTERAKLQIDERTSDLAALMRARGVNLSELKTSIDARAHSDGRGDAEGRGRQPSDRLSRGRSVAAVAAVADANNGDAGAAETPAGEIGPTYRA